MTQQLKSWKVRVSLFVAVLAVGVVGAYELVPRCSALGQKLSTMISSATYGSIAAANTCDASAKDLSKQVFFVSCGGFF